MSDWTIPLRLQEVGTTNRGCEAAQQSDKKLVWGDLSADRENRARVKVCTMGHTKRAYSR